MRKIATLEYSIESPAGEHVQFQLNYTQNRCLIIIVLINNMCIFLHDIQTHLENERIYILITWLVYDFFSLFETILGSLKSMQ